MTSRSTPVTEPKHCDDYIHDFNAPIALRVWLLVHRLPAIDKLVFDAAGYEPTLYADLDGRRVRCVMASRLGDVGITHHLHMTHGYQRRVSVEALTNFSKAP